MFLLLQILRCSAGRQAEAVARLHWIHEQMARHPGAQGMVVAKYLGNPTDFLILRQWQDRTDYESFMASPAGDFPKSKPAGIYDSLPVAHHWNEVLYTPGYAVGDFIWRSTYRVSPERWDDFLRLRKEDDKLAQWYALAERPGIRFGALVEARTFRSADDSSDAMAIVRLQDRAAMEDIVAAPSRAEIVAQLMARETHPGNASAPRDSVLSECYEVVDEIAAGTRVA
jgi:hypothetical protein